MSKQLFQGTNGTIITREYMTESSWLDSFKLPTELTPNAEQFNVIWNLHPQEHSEVMIYGKLTSIPRFQRAYVHDYKFSGVVAKAHPLPPEVKTYVDWANTIGYGEFNEVLLNWYLSEHYIGSHRDATDPLKPLSPIVTITLALPGTERKFRIRDESKAIVKDVLTPNGTVLVMGGNFQKEFKHEIVKITGAKAKEAGARISITLRQFK